MEKEYTHLEQTVIDKLGQWDDDWIISASYDSKSHGEIINFCIHVETIFINCEYIDCIKSIQKDGNWLIITGQIF